MKNDEILSQITEFCRKADMAESTFGRRAVNDGKLVHRLREGKRITIDTLDRIQAYMAASTAGGAAAAPGASGAAGKTRSARQFPLSSRTAKNTCCSSIPAARSGWSPSASRWSSPASIPGRRRCASSMPGRRRHGAGPGAARDAPALSAHAVLRRRQGAEPRGPPPDAGQGAGSHFRASGLGVRFYQHALRGGALAHAGIARGSRGDRLARGSPASFWASSRRKSRS